MVRTLKTFSVALLMCSFLSCDDNNDDVVPPQTTTFQATLNGSSETPANASTATGSSTLVFNNTTKIFTVTTTYTGLTVTGAHIHKGAVGVPGNIVFPFTVSPSPITFTSIALTAAEEADLFANLYYVNLHTTAYPGGEIRGQLMKQ